MGKTQSYEEVCAENAELRERLTEAADVMAETGRIADAPAAKRAWAQGKPADPKGYWTR
jgi:hypothetical protein